MKDAELRMGALTLLRNGIHYAADEFPRDLLPRLASSFLAAFDIIDDDDRRDEWMNMAGAIVGLVGLENWQQLLPCLLGHLRGDDKDKRMVSEWMNE